MYYRQHCLLEISECWLWIADVLFVEPLTRSLTLRLLFPSTLMFSWERIIYLGVIYFIHVVLSSLTLTNPYISSAKIDYFMAKNVNFSSFEITEPEVNFSEYVLIIVKFNVTRCSMYNALNGCSNCHLAETYAKRLRWYRADLISYFMSTHNYLRPFLEEFKKMEDNVVNYTDVSIIEAMYVKLVDSINGCDKATVPVFKQKRFLHFYGITN